MWIRSQKGAKLINANNFGVIERSGSYYRFKYPYCIETMMENVSIYLGEYSTMKKALKVLDMIEEQINLTEEYRTQGEDVIESENSVARKSRLVRFVFQMPQDSEVEE